MLRVLLNKIINKKGIKDDVFYTFFIYSENYF